MFLFSNFHRHRRRDQDQNLLHLFVRSILPTYNPNEVCMKYQTLILLATFVNVPIVKFVIYVR